MESKNGNTNLRNAKKQKKDEFYTQMGDIEKELIHYINHFRNKIIFCNCHDDKHSNFFRYFILNFENLSLKRLLATHFEKEGQSYFFDVNRDNFSLPPRHIDGSYNWDKLFTLKKPLKENGDFRSLESIELLKQSDIVVTNPPFSLFREYVAQLVEYHKKFLIMSNINAVTYKDIFPLIKENKIWFGSGSTRGNTEFRVPDSYPLIGSIRWFTNLDIPKRHEDLILYKHYDPKEYPKYDNYDAINVNKTVDIPIDYDGVMGVPITFLDKYNPNQFELVGELNNGSDNRYDFEKPIINGKKIFKRILIKIKSPEAISS